MATKTLKTAPAARKLARVVPKPQPEPAEAPAASTATYRMPVDVANWIEQAESRLRHAATEIARLKEENRDLRHSYRLMEQRVMGRSDE